MVSIDKLYDEYMHVGFSIFFLYIILLATLLTGVTEMNGSLILFVSVISYPFFLMMLFFSVGALKPLFTREDVTDKEMANIYDIMVFLLVSIPGIIPYAYHKIKTREFVSNDDDSDQNGQKSGPDETEIYHDKKN